VRDFKPAYVRVGSRSEELDLSISGPLLPSKAYVVVAFEPVVAIAAIRRTVFMEYRAAEAEITPA